MSDITSRKSNMVVLSDMYDDKHHYHSNMYTNMLIDDVKLMILPYLDKKNYEVLLIGGDSNDEKLIIDAISDRDYYRSLKDGINDFFRISAEKMMTYGKVYFEIAYLKESSEENWSSFKLYYIPPYSLKYDSGVYVQTVYQKNEVNNLVKKKIFLNVNKILECKLPTYIYDDHDHIMSSLINLSSVPPSFAFPFQNSEGTPFDFNLHTMSQNLALAYSTRKIGWNARNIFENKISENYYVHRILLFQKFLIILRNQILESLNSAIRIVSENLEIKGQIVFNNFPTLADIDRFNINIETGDTNFKEIIDFFY